MKTKQIFLYGYRGAIVRLLDASVKASLVEVDNNFLSQDNQVGQLSFCSSFELDFLELKMILVDIYHNWGRFGYMGDVIAVNAIKTNSGWVYTIAFIGRLAINKPGLAADLLPIFKVGAQEFYFVGIKRKYEPGKGLLALMGGFIDVKGYHLDTPIETVIHEAEEEIGLKIDPIFEVKDHNDLSLKHVPVRVNFPAVGENLSECYGSLTLHGVFPTGDNEKMPNLRLKRVYQTTVYSLFVNMENMGINEKRLRQYLKAGDDADELVIVNLNEINNMKFGLEHHQKIFSSVIKELKRY